MDGWLSHWTPWGGKPSIVVVNPVRGIWDKHIIFHFNMWKKDGTLSSHLHICFSSCSLPLKCINLHGGNWFKGKKSTSHNKIRGIKTESWWGGREEGDTVWAQFSSMSKRSSDQLLKILMDFSRATCWLVKELLFVASQEEHRWTWCLVFPALQSWLLDRGGTCYFHSAALFISGLGANYQEHHQ